MLFRDMQVWRIAAQFCNTLHFATELSKPFVKLHIDVWHVNTNTESWTGDKAWRNDTLPGIVYRSAVPDVRCMIRHWLTVL